MKTERISFNDDILYFGTFLVHLMKCLLLIKKETIQLLVTIMTVRRLIVLKKLEDNIALYK